MYMTSNMQPLRLYRNVRFFLPFQSADRRKGNLVLLAGMNLENNIGILNSRMIDQRYNVSYYTDVNVVLDSGAVFRRERVIQRDVYSEVKSNSPSVKRTHPFINQYAGLNLYYDIHRYNELFFKSIVYSAGRKADLYADSLNGLLSQESLKDYTKKTVIIPMTGEIGERNLSHTSVTDPLSAIYSLVFFDTEKFTTLFKDVEFFIISPKSNIMLKFDSSSLTKKELPRLRHLLEIIGKVNSKKDLSDEERGTLVQTASEFNQDGEEVGSTTTKAVMGKIRNELGMGGGVKSLTGEEVDLEDKLEEIAEKVEEKTAPKTEADLLEELNQNDEFVQYAQELANERLTAAKSNRNTKRNEILREEHRKVKVNGKGKTLEQVLTEHNEKKLHTEELKINVRNTQLKSSTLSDFEKSYNKNQMEKDTLMILNSFSNSDKEIPMHIRDIKKENTSDSFNKKETWTIQFEDERRQRHTVKIDVPIFVDDKFVFLNGSKKSISKQLLLVPIAKTGPDTVQVTSNYNKAFVVRYGQKISPKIERLRKFLSQTKSKKISMATGNNNLVNVDFLTNMEYDELAGSFMYLKFGDTVIHFNQDDLREEIGTKKIDISKLKDNQLPIGFSGKNLIVLNVETNLVDGTKSDLTDFIIDEIAKVEPGTNAEMEQISVGKKYVYTRVKALSRWIPMIILLSYKDGLTSVMQKAGVRHEFTEKRRNLSLEEKNRLGMIPFKDGYLYYDLYPFANSLLLNALHEVPTKEYEYSAFDGKEVYLDLFQSMYGTRNIGKGYENFTELFLDPITVEVLEDLNYPTEFTDVFLFANKLLEDNTFTKENNMNLYRIRSNEMVNALLYQILARAYAAYKNTSNSSNPVKVSVPQDILTKELLELPLVEDYSIINPIREAEAYGSITYKGPSGLNLDEAFTLDKRSYDETMLGLLAVSSPYNNKVGVSRQLAYSPRILSNRGLIKSGTKDDPDLNMANMLSPAELLTPFAANHDDPPRTAMTSGQSKHVIPVKKTDKLLIGNGSEKALPHILGDDFVKRAREDGVIETVDVKSGIMILAYKDGTKDAVDLSPTVAKNGGGGFYISNTKVTDLKKGDKFKKGDIVARNGEYFQGPPSDTEYVIGNLTKIAVHSGYYTFEDSSIATQQFCEQMTSYITMKKEVILGPNTNVDFIVKKGQQIKTGDSLIVFEQSYAEKEANQLLAKLGADYKEQITELSKNRKKSEYTGVVEDIKIYYTCDRSELSPSLLKIVNAYRSEVKIKDDILKKHFKDHTAETNIILPPTETIQTKDGKVKGVDVGNGVFIEFYIKYEDEMGVGDKATFYTALKTIIAEKIPDELAPYSEHNPDEQIGCILSHISVAARMTASIWLALYGNKVLIELKRKIKEVYES